MPHFIMLVYRLYVCVHRYFSQGTIDDRDYGLETGCSMFGIVLYRAADCLPNPSCDTLGPFSSASRVLNTIDKIE